MSIGMLATALTVTFVVSVVVLVAELLFLLWRRRSFPSPDHSSAKQLLNFFCLKPQAVARVEPSGTPTQKPPEDTVIDVFKLLEANGPSRVLCTIKEDDREDVESSSNSVEIGIIEIEKVSLQKFLECEAAEARAVTVAVEDTKTAFYSPCDSPMFFTPVGSPPQDTT